MKWWLWTWWRSELLPRWVTMPYTTHTHPYTHTHTRHTRHTHTIHIHIHIHTHETGHLLRGVYLPFAFLNMSSSSPSNSRSTASTHVEGVWSRCVCDGPHHLPPTPHTHHTPRIHTYTHIQDTRYIHIHKTHTPDTYTYTHTHILTNTHIHTRHTSDTDTPIMITNVNAVHQWTFFIGCTWASRL
jgi:hypothetical protein